MKWSPKRADKSNPKDQEAEISSLHEKGRFGIVNFKRGWVIEKDAWDGKNVMGNISPSLKY